MNQPILTFSPDGGTKMFLLTAHWRVYVVLLLSVLMCFSLALVKLYELAMGVFTFFLTAPDHVLIRLFALVLAFFLVPLGMQWLHAFLKNRGTISC